MSESTELNVILSLIDNASAKLKAVTDDIKKQTSGITDESKKLQDQSDKTNKKMQDGLGNTSKQLRSFRKEMFVVTVAIGAIIYSLNEWSKYNEETRSQIDKFKDSFSKLIGLFGSGFTPALVGATDLLGRFTEQMQMVSTVIRNTLTPIVQTAGAITSFVSTLGEIMKPLVNPFGLIHEAIDKAKGKFVELGKIIVSTTKENLPNITALRREMQYLSEAAESANLQFVLGKISGDAYYTKLREQSQASLSNLQQESTMIKQIAALKNLVANDETVNRMKNYREILQSLNDEKTAVLRTNREILADWSNSMSGFSGALSAYAAENKRFAEAAKAIAIASTIMKTQEAVMDAWAKGGSWGEKLAMAGMAAAQGALSVATIAAQKFHSGGIVRNNLGSDEVPIIAQTGERVLSREQNMKYEGGKSGGGVTVNVNTVIQAWDASDVMRNQEIIKAAVNSSIVNNGQLRKLIREYA
jgi:hypothetical protein